MKEDSGFAKQPGSVLDPCLQSLTAERWLLTGLVLRLYVLALGAQLQTGAGCRNASVDRSHSVTDISLFAGRFSEWYRATRRLEFFENAFQTPGDFGVF